MIKLGRFKQVKLRNVWETEAKDFTPWLAIEENIKILGDTIDLELELEATEKDVGPFRADIICKNTHDDSWVLIENQIERTDHKHLGQLLTYAAGLDAVTIVWIAAEFTQEHRAALDWLNKITNTNFRFFGLKVELWSIDGSLAAPRFNPISQPNDWSATVSKAKQEIKEDLSPLQELQLKYWTHLSEYFNQHSKLEVKSPSAKAWHNFSIGKTNASLAISISIQRKKLKVNLALYKNMKEEYAQIYEQKNAIENDLGKDLIWENDPNKQTAIIKTEKTADIDNERDWPEQHEWFRTKIEAFIRVFRPIVKEF